MRLLFLVSSLPFRKIGGTEIMTLRICEHLAMGGEHEPFIHTIARSDRERDGEALEELFVRYDITHLRRENISFSSRTNTDALLSYTRANLSYAMGLKHVVRRVRPDLVVSMKVMPPEVMCTRLPSVLSRDRIPYLLMVRGFTDLQNAPLAEGYGVRPSLPERLRDSFYFGSRLPRYIKRAAGIIAQTSSQQEFLKHHYGVDSTIIPNPIDTERILDVIEAHRPKEGSGEEKGEKKDEKEKTEDDGNRKSENEEGWKGKKEKDRGEEGQEKGTIINLIYVGSMIPRKDLGTLLRAMRILKDGTTSDNGTGEEKLPTEPKSTPTQDFHLNLVGGGRGEERARELVRELGLEHAVVFKGNLLPEELWPFMSSCDIFVFPSLSEGFPNALLEAMSCGLPIISSEFSGVHDIVRSERNGMVFRKGDPGSLAHCILSMAGRTDLREMGSYNREFVKQFTWQHFIEQFKEVIRTVMGTEH